MHQTLKVSRLKILPLFTPLAIGWAAIWLPIAAIAGITSLFGAKTVTLNDHVVTGISGLLTAFAIGLVGPILSAALVCIMAGVGLWLYSRLFGAHNISFVNASEAKS